MTAVPSGFVLYTGYIAKRKLNPRGAMGISVVKSKKALYIGTASLKAIGEPSHVALCVDKTGHRLAIRAVNEGDDGALKVSKSHTIPAHAFIQTFALEGNYEVASVDGYLIFDMPAGGQK